VLDAAGELTAQQGAESDFVPLPAAAAHPSPP
jgi:hypothetical protein